VSLDLRGVAVTFLTATLRALGAAAAPDAAAASLSTSHLRSLGALLGLLPVRDLIEIANGRASWDNVLDAAAHGADIVRAVFPPSAMTATEVKLALEALRFVLDAAGVGPTPFTIAPGQNPIRGGFAGARGHV
jgi:hypothetical protein